MTRALMVHRFAWLSLTAAAKRALPLEVGGLLLGYYTADGPRVVDAPAVPDPRATRIRYRRDATLAGHILDLRLRADNTGLLGYLGEWHTHPLPVGPSGTDLQSVRNLAADGGHDVALLVLALGPVGWKSHARNATPSGNVQTIEVCVEGASA